MADGLRSQGAVGDAGVRHAGRAESKKIGVVSDDYATVGQRIRQMFAVCRRRQSGLGGGRGIKSATAQTVGDCDVHVFVEMKPQRCSSGLPTHAPDP